MEAEEEVSEVEVSDEEELLNDRAITGSAYRISKVRLPPVAVVFVDDDDEYQAPRPDTGPVARPHWRTPPPNKAPAAVARPHWRTPSPNKGPVALPHWRALALAVQAAPATPWAMGSVATQPARNASWPRGLTEIYR